MDNIREHSSPNTHKILLGNKIDVPGKQVRGTHGARLFHLLPCFFYVRVLLVHDWCETARML